MYDLSISGDGQINRRGIMRKTVVVLLLLTAVTTIASAQKQNNPDLSASQVVSLMKSQAWTDREKGFKVAVAMLRGGAQSRSDEDNLRMGLIQLVMVEEHEAATPSSSDDGERHEEYFAALVEAVANLHDARAIPSLLAVAGTGGMATRGVARFGKLALDAVIVDIRGQDLQRSGDSLWILRDMLAFRTASDPESQAKIKDVLRYCLGHPESRVRGNAISVLEYLDDREDFVPALRYLADRDPYKLVGERSNDSQDNGEIYPVRRGARILLSKITKHEKPVVPKIPMTN
jgi:hypothetical protein